MRRVSALGATSDNASRSRSTSRDVGPGHGEQLPAIRVDVGRETGGTNPLDQHHVVEQVEAAAGLPETNEPFGIGSDAHALVERPDRVEDPAPREERARGVAGQGTPRRWVCTSGTASSSSGVSHHPADDGVTVGVGRKVVDPPSERIGGPAVVAVAEGHQLPAHRAGPGCGRRPARGRPGRRPGRR